MIPPTRLPSAPSFLRYATLVVPLLAPLLVVAATPAFGQGNSRNVGPVPPVCAVAQMMQDNGQFPSPPFGAPGCALPNNAGVAVGSAEAVYDEKGFYRLEASASGGAVTRGGMSYPVEHVSIWNYRGYRGGCFEWTPGDGQFECAPNIEYRNPDGSGGGGDQVGFCDPPCKLRFRPIRQEAHWFRMTVLGYAPGAGSYSFHAGTCTM